MKFKTAQQKKDERERKRAKTAQKYRFEPVGLDIFSPGYAARNLSPGDLVIKTQPSGCPKNGTMGQTYVADLEGRFLGMVSLGSLTKI